MLNPQHLTLVRWISAYFAWQFFTTGSILFVSAVLRTLEGQSEGLVLFPVGLFLLFVGDTCLRTFNDT